MRGINIAKHKKYGIAYTPQALACYVAEEMLKYRPCQAKDAVSILDPAVGSGDLLIAMIDAIGAHDKKIRAVGYETDVTVGKATQAKLEAKFPHVEVDIRVANFLESVESGVVGKHEYVIANPPYVRTQVIGSEMAKEISKKLSLSGRIDLYYAFLIYTKEVLEPYGIAGFITSNKFLTIKSGISVRNFMLKNYLLHQIIDLGDTKLFNSAILPCITLFSLGVTTNKEGVNFTSVYETKKADEYKNGDDLFRNIKKNGIYKLSDNKCYRVQTGKISSVDTDTLWTISSEKDDIWLNKVKINTWGTFAKIGKVRVGIKTTADNVFIGNKWGENTPDLELLKPLITHRNAGHIVGNKKSQWKVLYTHTTENGKRIPYDIEKFPKSKEYLLKHYDQLNSRGYVKKAKRNWYEIWVPQNPATWKHRKIVFRDISEHPQFWLDESGAIVNGDCYWIEIFPEIADDVIYLALAVANSSFIEKYYDLKFNTRLYSGKRRYQAQYVEQFPIPCPNTDSAKCAITLVKNILANDKCDFFSYKKQIDSLISTLFIN